MDEPVFDLRIHEEAAWSYIGLVMYSSYSTFLISAFVFTGRKIYQDLFTTERVSLNHRRTKPERTTSYKLMLMLVQFAIFFYFIADMSMLFTYVMVTDRGCYVQQTIAGTTWHTGKTLMYILFLARLYMVYKPSAYAYNAKCICGIGTVIVIYALALVVIMVLIWRSTVYPFDGINKFPNYCDGTLEAVTGGLIALEDMAVSVGFLAAFIIPLRKTIKSVNASTKQLKFGNNALIKIRYAGTKHTIITAVAMSSTFLLVFVTVATDLNFVIGFDPVINTICMVLLTPYLPDDKYYEKLCRLCIVCCTKEHVTYDHNKAGREAQNNNNNKQIEDTFTSGTNLTAATAATAATATATATAGTINLSSTNMKSVDTMDQLGKTAAQINPKTNINNQQYESISTKP